MDTFLLILLIVGIVISIILDCIQIVIDKDIQKRLDKLEKENEKWETFYKSGLFDVKHIWNTRDLDSSKRNYAEIYNDDNLVGLIGIRSNDDCSSLRILNLMNNKNDREYYKVVIDLLKNIITALFVADLGLMGYVYKTNDIIVLMILFVDALIILCLTFFYFDIAQNLRDWGGLYGI